MRKLPRALNRILLFLFGLLFLASGTLLVGAATYRPLRDLVLKYRSRLDSEYTSLAQQATFKVSGQQYSWVQVGLIVVAIIVALLLLSWIFSQGGGKIRSLALNAAGKDSEKKGEITAELGLLQGIIEDEISDSRWISSLKVASWDVKKQPGLLLSAAVYKGANPREVKAELDQAIARLDQVLGINMPILVRLTTNWRSNLGSADRVDSEK
ncbi:hypothetical protein HMPREF1862_01016 [Varibaculum cambriense]|uniref:Alkaline shock response membrane anchor protein AmaP n=1 Tax=Varibaculum cambriense TaxID=184870 RepID=A0AB34WZA8_9ACTO|nr:hypothetical protein [Varibaculum cambriense]KXB80709.1 hypothetical protein HMPREF1862_01016 [Varibaculum cambriense]